VGPRAGLEDVEERKAAYTKTISEQIKQHSVLAMRALTSHYLCCSGTTQVVTQNVSFFVEN
jgi:hypothetical protein